MLVNGRQWAPYTSAIINTIDRDGNNPPFTLLLLLLFQYFIKFTNPTEREQRCALASAKRRQTDFGTVPGSRLFLY